MRSPVNIPMHQITAAEKQVLLDKTNGILTNIAADIAAAPSADLATYWRAKQWRYANQLKYLLTLETKG